jgi:hypothetical protein
MTDEERPGYHWPDLRAFLDEIDKRTDQRFRGSDRFHEREMEQVRIWITAMLDERDRRYQQRFDGNERSVRDALASAALAVNKAEAAVNTRLEGMNEFRDALKDQTATLMPRSEFDVQFKALGDSTKESLDRLSTQLASIREVQGTSTGRQVGGERVTGVVLAIGSLLVSLGAVIAVIAFHH